MQAQEIYLKGYQPPNHLVDSVFLTFEIFEGRTLVSSEINFFENPANPSNVVTLLGRGVKLVSVDLAGKLLSDGEYSKGEESLTIPNCPKEFTLKLVTEIYPEENKALEGLYRSSGMYCTQCEPEGFRRITFFPDRPDVTTKFTTKIVADKSIPVLLSNGNKIDQGDLPDGRHFATWEDPFNKPSYLFALVAGDLVVNRSSFTTMSGRDVVLEIWVESANSDKTDHAMACLKQSMKWDEEVYGLEYDLDIFMIVAVDDFNMGAMENKGLNIFNSSCILADSQTATDGEFLNIQGIIGHEYFHNWSGNRVTLRDWFQLSLKEGLTIFRDQNFTQDLNSASLGRIMDVKMLKSAQFPEDHSPMAHPVRPASFIEINNFYTSTVYNKGAELIRMMYNFIGPVAYRKAMDLYFSKNDGKSATIEDFLSALETGSGQSLEGFKSWYRQSGTPEITVTESFDAAKGEFTLNITQVNPETASQKAKEPLLVPIKMGLLSSDGEPLPCQLKAKGNVEDASAELTLMMGSAKESYTFIGLKEKPIPSLLRGFSSPVKLKTNPTQGELATLLAKDSDAYNRYEACQLLLMNQLQDWITNGIGAPTDVLLTAIQTLLKDESADPALVAAMLLLPTEAFLVEQNPQPNIEAIYDARGALKTMLATSLKTEFLATYERSQVAEPYQFTQTQTGKRALANLSLRYIVATGDANIALAQAQGATNMTLRLGALAALNDSESVERLTVLREFAEEFAKNSLVMNHWFRLQAVSPLSNVEMVEELKNHPAYDQNNPNKLRALIGAFAVGNLKEFHRKDTKGYQLLTSEIIRLNLLNPQMGARLISPLSRFKHFAEAEASAMKAQLQLILDTPNLSKNIFEIASKALA
ncbi:MAG: aminopeptidase N [SAR324 cluster bacterium]|nr:aminopeptidase N [SAR324 cluster bacterium]